MAETAEQRSLKLIQSAFSAIQRRVKKEGITPGVISHALGLIERLRKTETGVGRAPLQCLDDTYVKKVRLVK